MRVIVTEKPSMGRDVAAALGATRRGEGFVSGESDIVTWCVGHLVELDDPQAYDPRFERWRVEDLPILPEEFKYHASERTLEQFNVIRALLGREDVNSVVNAADAGRDGELIFDLVYTLGRVQTPTLALIVERDREIAEFVPTDYFEVVATFRAPGGEYRGRWFGKDGSRFDKKEDAETVVRKVEGKSGAVASVEKKAAREKPPLLHDLTSLQRAANVRYAFTATKTLELAQSLYEKKFVTYPRTSSRHLSKAVAEEIEAHVRAASVGPYVPFIEKILAAGKPRLTSRHVDDKKVTDHHAVIPTKQHVRPDALSPDEKRVYDLVARRFLAAFFPDAEIERTTVVTEAA